MPLEPGTGGAVGLIISTQGTQFWRHHRTVMSHMGSGCANAAAVVYVSMSLAQACRTGSYSFCQKGFTLF